MSLETLTAAEEESVLLAQENTEVRGFDRLQVIDLCRSSLNFLASLLMPETFIYNFPPLHIAVWGLLTKAILKSEEPGISPSEKFPKFAIGWPRGMAKTTLVKILVLWAIFFTNKKFILVVASNLTKAQNIVSDIWDMLSEENVLNVWGNCKLSVELDRQDLKKFSFGGRSIIIGAIGAGGDPRGLNIKNVRPDMIITDDAQAKENSDSPLQAKNLLGWLTATLMKAKSPHGCITIYIGNMFSSPGCILKMLKTNPNWTSVIVAGILADKTSIWPDLRSVEDLLQELKDDIALGTPEAFFSEIMNDPDAGITSCFDITKVPPCLIPKGTTIPASFIIIDVATDKIGADDTTIVRYGVYGSETVVEETETGVMNPETTIKRALIMALKAGVPLICVEDVAYQSSLLFWFQKVCQMHEIAGIQFEPVKPKGRPKNSRILTMFKRLISNEKEKTLPTLYLRDDCRAKVFWEISQFKPDKRDNVDNILDNLGYAEDVIMDYGMLIWNALSVESQAFSEAKVLSNNSAF